MSFININKSKDNFARNIFTHYYVIIILLQFFCLSPSGTWLSIDQECNFNPIDAVDSRDDFKKFQVTRILKEQLRDSNRVPYLLLCKTHVTKTSTNISFVLSATLKECTKEIFLILFLLSEICYCLTIHMQINSIHIYSCKSQGYKNFFEVLPIKK